MKKLICMLLAVMMAGTQLVFAEEKLSGGDPANVLTFEELTGLSREEIDHIVIRSGVDGVGYSTAYDKVVSDIYDAINTKSFNVYMKEGNSGGWKYTILFFDKDNSKSEYTIGHGIVSNSGITYRTSNEEELENVVENAYKLISSDCSSWAGDYIVEAKDLGFLEGLSESSYKRPVTREKFCEMVYNMLDKTMDIKWQKTCPNPFKDTLNEKVFSLRHEGIVSGRGGYTFAPYDYLTREEAAAIIIRTAERMEIGMPETAYDEKVYDDEAAISPWAFPAVHYCRKLDIMKGIGDNKFAPQDNYTAEQAIASVVRLYGLR